MRRLPDHLKGLLLTGIGVLVLSPDSLLVRLIAIDQWSMVFWRGVLTAAALTGYLAICHGRRTAAKFRAMGTAGLAVVVVLATGSSFFVIALNHTSVANTLVIVSTAPLFASAFSWLYLVEPVPARTVGAIVAAIGGIAILASDSAGAGFFAGDVAALVTAICMAGSLTLIRWSGDLDMIPAIATSGVLSALVVLPWATPLAVAPDQIGLLLLLGLGVLPIAFALTALGPRYLPAAEVALILLLETVLGPLWVWLAIREEPSRGALIGGAIVVVSLLLHAVLGWRDPKRSIQRPVDLTDGSRRNSSPSRRSAP